MELNVDVEGPPDAPAVVLLHGVTGCGSTYGFLHPQDLGGRRIVRVDLRGHGGSPHAAGTYRIPAFADDVVELLRGLGGPPPVLAGHSLGGLVAWTVAQQHPELICGAFLEDPPLYFSQADEAGANAGIAVVQQLRAATQQWRSEGLSEAEVTARVAAAPGSELLCEDAAECRAYALLALDMEVLDATIDNSIIADADLEAPVGVPVLLLAGDEAAGAAFHARHAARLAATHPEVEVVVVPGASHLIHHEQRSRDAYVRELAAFAERCGG
jgi:pimeloyl-ACP methyl ester carboxylesterase